MDLNISVLDKGYVKYIRSMGDDLSPVEDARMSTNNPTGVDENKDDKLRTYLWKNSHSSPFEGCALTLELKIPLFILHQLDRHRTIDLGTVETFETYDTFRKYTSRNEFSGRYGEFQDEFYIPPLERIGGQDFINKQNTSGEIPEEYKKQFIDSVSLQSKVAYSDYEDILKIGISKEIARLRIPNNVYTKIRITANLLNWFKFLILRLEKGAQYEIREYANAIGTIIQHIWPKCYDVFVRYSLSTVTVDKEITRAAFYYLINKINILSNSTLTFNELLSNVLGEKNTKELASKLEIK